VVRIVFLSRFMPCGKCGESLDRSAAPSHRCDPRRRVEFQMFALRAGVAAFEDRLHEHLDTATGRFETWLAAQQVRGRRRR
jgi:hypothetical protein